MLARVQCIRGENEFAPVLFAMKMAIMEIMAAAQVSPFLTLLPCECVSLLPCKLVQCLTFFIAEQDRRQAALTALLADTSRGGGGGKVDGEGEMCVRVCVCV